MAITKVKGGYKASKTGTVYRGKGAKMRAVRAAGRRAGGRRK